MQWPYWGKFTGPYLTLNSWDRRGIQGCVRPICCSMWPMGSLSCSFRSKTQRRDSLRKWHHFWYLWVESLTLPPDSSWRDSPALPVKDDVFFCLYLLLWTRCPFSFFHFFLTFCFCQSGLCCLGFQLVRNVNALYFELFFFCFFLKCDHQGVSVYFLVLGIFVSITPPVLIDLFGVDKLSSTLGTNYLVIGTGYLLGGPLMRALFFNTCYIINCWYFLLFLFNHS